MAGEAGVAAGCGAGAEAEVPGGVSVAPPVWVGRIVIVARLFYGAKEIEDEPSR